MALDDNTMEYSDFPCLTNGNADSETAKRASKIKGLTAISVYARVPLNRLLPDLSAMC